MSTHVDAGYSGVVVSANSKTKDRMTSLYLNIPSVRFGGPNNSQLRVGHVGLLDNIDCKSF